MNRKKTIAIILLFCVLALTLGMVWFLSQPQTSAGSKHISVEVVHSDGSEKGFEYDTDAEYLSEVLLEEGLIEGEQSAYGLYVKVVDGETADYDIDASYWALYINGEYAMTGADTTPINDGDVYNWTYTK
ncbi:MAG: DUF4430 domain-containing protein [Firmicutes bacterium]|nr:DUF4430 domain-containing protein [Bacillota bacterium]